MAELYPVMEHDPSPSVPERKRLVWLSFAIAASPSLWAAQVLLLSAFTNYACYPGDSPETGPIASMRWVPALELSIDVIAIAVSSIAGWIAWRYFMIARKRIGTHAGDSLELWHLDRLCFMSLGGLLSSSGFLAAILFETIASIMVVPCGS